MSRWMPGTIREISLTVRVYGNWYNTKYRIDTEFCNTCGMVLPGIPGIVCMVSISTMIPGILFTLHPSD